MKTQIDNFSLSVDSLKALDKLVAEKVMGWKEMDWDNPVIEVNETRIYEQYDHWAIYQDAGSHNGTLWSPSRYINSAWAVVEEVFNTYSKEVTVEFGWDEHPIYAWHCYMGLWDATAPTPTLAICIASLLTKGIVIEPTAPLDLTWQCWR